MYIRFLHGSIVFVQQKDDPFAVIARKIRRQRMQRIRSQIVLHIRRYLSEIFLFILIHAITVKQIAVTVIQIFDYLANLLSGIRKCGLLHAGKGEADDRIRSLQLPVLLFLPDGQACKIRSFPRISYREKMLQHAHRQGLAKAPGTGEQRDHILIFPPLPDEFCLIDIETIRLN